MKRVMALGAFFGLCAFGGTLFAQEMDNDKDPEKGADKAEEAEEAPNRGARRPARGQRGDMLKLTRALRELDADGDRKLSSDELGDDDLFKKLDKDEDGFLTVREMLGDVEAVVKAADDRAAEVVKEEFGILDRNDDGVLDKDELGEKWAHLLDNGDADKDGKLTLEEFKATRRPAPEEGARGQRGNIIERLDKDGDGKISKEEAPARLKERFDDIDENGDGFIDQEELEKALRARRGNRDRPGRGNDRRGDRDKPKESDEPKKDAGQEDDF